MKQIKLRNKLRRAALEGNCTDSHVWATQSGEAHAANNSPTLTQERGRKTNSSIGPKQQHWAHNRHFQSGPELPFSGTTSFFCTGMAQLCFLHPYGASVSTANCSGLALDTGYSENALKLIWQHRERG